MKQILNFIITGVILYLAAKFYPAAVQIADTKSLILATVLLFIAEIIVVIAIFIMMAVSFFSGNWGGIVVGAIAICFAEIIALTLVSEWIPGITITGFWTKFILAFVLSVFRIPEKNNND